MAAPPAFADISKAANDLLNKDFYHTQSANVEVKTTAPNGVTFNVKGKTTHESKTSASLEAKLNDAASGIAFTQSWNTANALDTKIEVDNKLAKGVKAELLTNYLPATQAYGAKANLYFKQPNVHGRFFLDLLKGPVATVDATIGHEGFLVGAEAAYDVQKATLTKYSAAIGYQQPFYSAAITATDSLSVFAASYYHKVNSDVEAGAKAIWDSKAGNNVGLELASKYRIDPMSFAKAKVNDRGIASLAYNVLLRPGFQVGLGASFDTNKLNEASHKVGASFIFTG